MYYKALHGLMESRLLSTKTFAETICSFIRRFHRDSCSSSPNEIRFSHNSSQLRKTWKTKTLGLYPRALIVRFNLTCVGFQDYCCQILMSKLSESPQRNKIRHLHHNGFIVGRLVLPFYISCLLPYKPLLFVIMRKVEYLQKLSNIFKTCYLFGILIGIQ